MFNQEIGLNNVEDAKIWLTSSKGLLNGFVLAKTGNNSHRTSPIYLTYILLLLEMKMIYKN